MLRKTFLLASLFLLSTALLASSTNRQFKSLAVSPDGKAIALTVDDPHTSFIVKVSVETGEATRLTNAKSGFESSPSFSPDGKQIAFTFSPENSKKVHIFVVNSDGTQLHQWFSSEENDFRPLFSPDGKTLIFGRSSFYGSYSPIAQPYRHAWQKMTKSVAVSPRLAHHGTLRWRACRAISLINSSYTNGLVM